MAEKGPRIDSQGFGVGGDARWSNSQLKAVEAELFDRPTTAEMLSQLVQRFMRVRSGEDAQADNCRSSRQ